MGDIIGYDNEGNPIYGEAPKRETGKSFNDAIKDLYWDVLGREPDAGGLEAYKKAFGAEISPEEEQEFYRYAKEELRNRNEGAGDPLYKLYAQNLGRAPTLEEYRKSREQFGGDVSGEEEQQFFEQEVVPDLRRRQDPIFQLYQEELGRTPDAAGYRYYREEFGQPTVITDRMRQDFLGGGGYGESREIPDRMGSAFRDLMGRDPTDQEKQELSARVGTLNRDQLGNYLATQNLAGRSRYASSVAPMFGDAYDPVQRADYRFDYQDPFTEAFSTPLQYTNPRITAGMQKAGQKFYQTPSALDPNYTNRPDSISVGPSQYYSPNISQFYQTPSALGPNYTNRPSSISVGPSQYHVANLAGQYQTPSTPGVNYMGAPTNIRPITQGFQPVGQPSVPSYYPQSFQSMGGKGGFQFQPQSRSQQMFSQQAPTQQFQPMGGKGVPRAITGKGG